MFKLAFFQGLSLLQVKQNKHSWQTPREIILEFTSILVLSEFHGLAKKHEVLY